jgi:thiamine biosynthesis lipoprotein
MTSLSTPAAKRVAEHVLQHLERVMGTIVTIDIYSQGDGPNDVISLQVAQACEVLQRADAVFSTWKVDSPMSRLRRGEITLEQTPPEVTEVLEECAKAREITHGWFDPWSMPGGVDPTGYVKGWAAQRALGALVSTEIAGAIVNAAGDIASFGAMKRSQAFRVGIVDPFSPNRLACVVELTGAIATSGTYERGDHLIDPHSGRPRARVASASVSGPDLGLADALATAVAVAGDTALTLVETIEGYEALVVDFDGTLRSTERFPFASHAIPQR